ncbi:MAG: restriction endonuclease subunit R, partial [Tepidiformaceae bacterium]
PYVGNLSGPDRGRYADIARNLKKTLVFDSGLSPVGLLRNCLDFAVNQNAKLGGVFDAVRETFKVAGGRDLLYLVSEVNDFRNTYIAHQSQELTDKQLAEKQLKRWVEAMATLTAVA